MLGMMNNGCYRDDAGADVFYAVRADSSADVLPVDSRLRQIFGSPRQHRNVVSYLPDGRKRINGNLAAAAQKTNRPSPEQQWTALLIAKRMARNSLRRIRGSCQKNGREQPQRDKRQSKLEQSRGRKGAKKMSGQKMGKMGNGSGGKSSKI